MNAEWISVIIQGVLALGVAAAFYVNTVAQRKTSSAAELAAIERSRIEKEADTALSNTASKFYGLLNAFGDRLARVEERLDNLPHSKDVHAINLRCEELVGEMKKLTAQLLALGDSTNRQQRVLDRLEDFVTHSSSRAR
jgi:hypothetical protein